MDLEVKYKAWSNDSYRGTWLFTVDDDEWATLSEVGRNHLIGEMAVDKLVEDVNMSWDVESGTPTGHSQPPGLQPQTAHSVPG